MNAIKYIRRFLALSALGASALAADPRLPALDLVPWGTDFKIPVYLADPGVGSRLVVVEQEGRLIAADAANSSNRTVLLDIKDRVNHGGEKGLLSVAFHPKFARNGRFFVNYTTGADKKDLRTHISEFKADPKLGAVDPASEKVLLSFAQPYVNHNGGLVLFGPDGLLYIGNGDGGAANDPQNHGQRLDSLLGKMLRIDVDRVPAGQGYGIPKDNPFVATKDARPEIWAYGLRNPWRFSFDRKDGTLYAGDVGQNQWEEITLVRKGGNCGWRIMEGFHCTPKVSPPDCDQQGLDLPLLEYSHDEGISVTGGYVYRGKAFPALRGAYLYADYGSCDIWGVTVANGKASAPQTLATAKQGVASFAEDRNGELFVVGHSGTIWHLRAK
jgi:glucose/arabinose dehydrogenase